MSKSSKHTHGPRTGGPKLPTTPAGPNYTEYVLYINYTLYIFYRCQPARVRSGSPDAGRKMYSQPAGVWVAPCPTCARPVCARALASRHTALSVTSRHHAQLTVVLTHVCSSPAVAATCDGVTFHVPQAARPRD